jgi:tetratricopeptide (TPR) repeat protein
VRAGEILSKFVAEFPREPAYRCTLGTALANHGMALDALGQKQEALDALRRGIEQERIALDRSPVVAEYRRLLSRHYASQSSILLGLGRREEAFATTVLKEQLWPSDPVENYNAACEFCACIGPATLAPGDEAFRNRCHAAAIEVLRRAIQSGFRDATKLRSNPALATIRTRREFLTLIEDASFPEDPFAQR